MASGNAEIARRDGRGAVLSAEELPELLSDLAEAPDFPAAGNRLLEQFAEAAGSGRAILFVLDRFGQQLELAGHLGCGGDGPTPESIPLEAHGHPLVVSARGQSVVLIGWEAARRIGLPFAQALLLPLPQPYMRGLPSLQQDEVAFDKSYKGSEVFQWSGERRRRLGHAPFGVVAVDGRPEPVVVESLAGAALLAGPILARTHSADRLKRSAERLDEQRSLLTAVINALPDPIVITDAMNNVIVQNQRAEILLAPQDSDSEGRRRAVEINNLLFSSFVSKAVMTGGVKATARELNLVDPDEGTDLLFEVLAHPLPASIAREGAHVSVLRDVTDLKRASIELERQYQRARVTEMDATRERDRLNLILNNVGDPILVTDDQSNIILMNPLAELLFELPDGAHDLQRIQRVRGNDTKFTTLISDFAISAATYRRERITLVQPQSGMEVPMEVVAGKVVNERGEPLAIVCVLHDLTTQVENERLYNELKKFSAELEDRIRMATADLEAQNMRLLWQSSELEKAYRLKSEFLANMSHELRTPINALIGYTALMLDRIYGELTAKQVEGLTRIQVSSQHLLALINDILDLAKIEAGKMPIHLEPAQLKGIIVEVASQMEPLIKRKALEFSFDMPDDLPILITDRTKVKQIVLNLLSNAVKFTHRGVISLGVRAFDGMVEITVADTGIGIRPEHLEVIFEEFRQVDQSRTREYGGTGLGLSITRKLISLLGGSIVVASDYGVGSTFLVTLPMRSELLSMDEQVARAVTGTHRAG